MDSQIKIDDQTLRRLQQSGELEVQESRGARVVLMTVDAHRELRRIAYDDSPWTADDLRATVTPWLADPEGWGAPGKDEYDDVRSDS